jgi:hypothetical protein
MNRFTTFFVEDLFDCDNLISEGMRCYIVPTSFLNGTGDLQGFFEEIT